MLFGRVGQPIYEEFTVFNENDELVDSLDSTALTVFLYNPINAEVSVSSSLSFYNLGNGDYRIGYIPDTVGNWYMRITHPSLFPIGKANTTQVYANDFDTMTSILSRILGLVQENFAIDMTTHNEGQCMTASRIRTYTNTADVGTDNNILSTYQMNATYDADGNMESYSVVKQ
ncbi:hypothetical protein KAR91_15970 [Candidatus Pacearchaeota archaeon]|nr:hypothetical protein [Candidatus Pacearchaeota archaeon]